MRAQEVVERALALSRAKGCVVLVEEVTSTNLRWANSELTTNGTATTRRLTVISIAGRGAGTGVGVVSHVGAIDDHELSPLVSAAEAAARRAAPAPDAEPLVPAPPVTATWSDPVPTTSVRALTGVIAELGEAFAMARARDRLLYGVAEHRVGSTFLGSSTGVRLRHDESHGYVELTARAAGGGESGWASVPTTDFADVSVRGLYAEIESRLGRAVRRIDLPPGRYECLLPPAAVADLMNYVYWSGGARDAVEGRSVYSRAGGGTRLGERLTEAPLTLRSDPYEPGLRCAPFVVATASDAMVSVFDNGLPLAPTVWLEKGVLRALVQTRQTAREHGFALTPHVDNLILEGAEPAGTLDDLVARTRRGLLLTSLWYIREVDPRRLLLTGVTRDGVYLVERGEIVAAVNNFRFNDSPVAMLARVDEAGRTVPTRAREWADAFSRWAMPALRVADVTMSSATQAI
jgi:predicted Zn-dependent protease